MVAILEEEAAPVETRALGVASLDGVCIVWDDSPAIVSLLLTLPPVGLPYQGEEASIQVKGMLWRGHPEDEDGQAT